MSRPAFTRAFRGLTGHRTITPCGTRTVKNELLDKYIYSPSQDRVRYFSSQEDDKNFSHKELFLPDYKNSRDERKRDIGRARRKTQENLPEANRNHKSLN